MSETGKRDINPNATIQIQLDKLDGLDQVELLDPDAAPHIAAATKSSRPTPPPLPPTSQAPRAPRTRPGKAIVYAVLMAAIVAGAVAAGLAVGRRLRVGTPPAVQPSPGVAGPAAAPSASTLVLPPVEIRTR